MGGSRETKKRVQESIQESIKRIGGQSQKQPHTIQPKRWLESICFISPLLPTTTKSCPGSGCRSSSYVGQPHSLSLPNPSPFPERTTISSPFYVHTQNTSPCLCKTIQPPTTDKLLPTFTTNCHPSSIDWPAPLHPPIWNYGCWKRPTFILAI